MHTQLFLIVGTINTPQSRGLVERTIQNKENAKAAEIVSSAASFGGKSDNSLVNQN